MAPPPRYQPHDPHVSADTQSAASSSTAPDSSERRASEQRRGPQNAAVVPHPFSAGNGSRDRQGRRLTAVSHWSGLPIPYTFVSCDEAE